AQDVAPGQVSGLLDHLLMGQDLPCEGYAKPRLRMAWPAPARLANFISEYFRERTTPGTPARNAASTASRVPPGVHILLFAWVGMSISMPGRMVILVPTA